TPEAAIENVDDLQAITVVIGMTAPLLARVRCALYRADHPLFELLSIELVNLAEIDGTAIESRAILHWADQMALVRENLTCRPAKPRIQDYGVSTCMRNPFRAK